MTLKEHSKRGFKKGQTLIQYIDASIYSNVEQALSAYLKDVKNPNLTAAIVADYEGTINALTIHINSK